MVKKISAVIALVFVFCFVLAKANFNNIPTSDTAQPQETVVIQETVIQENNWEEPRPIEAPGLSNAYQISPFLYRGAQPKPEGYKSLADMGIKAIISFRTKAPDTELINKLGIKSYHIPIDTFKFNDEHARTFLKIISEQEGPVYIHCFHGSDRTGTMTALYRIVHQKWSREKALAEMRSKKFGFHKMFRNLVKYIKQVKLENIIPAPKVKKTEAKPEEKTEEKPEEKTEQK